MSFLLSSCEEIPPEALPAPDTISSPKANKPPSEPFISKGNVGHASNCEFLLKIYHFPSFWKSLSSTKLTPTLSAIYALPHQIEVSLYADILENILPFESQSINNFSGYDIFIARTDLTLGCDPFLSLSGILLSKVTLYKSSQ